MVEMTGELKVDRVEEKWKRIGGKYTNHQEAKYLLVVVVLSSLQDLCHMMMS